MSVPKSFKLPGKPKYLVKCIGQLEEKLVLGRASYTNSTQLLSGRHPPFPQLSVISTHALLLPFLFDCMEEGEATTVLRFTFSKTKHFSLNVDEPT